MSEFKFYVSPKLVFVTKPKQLGTKCAEISVLAHETDPYTSHSMTRAKSVVYMDKQNLQSYIEYLQELVDDLD